MSEIKSFEIFAPLVSSFRLSEPSDSAGFEQVKISSHTWKDSSNGVAKELPAIWFRPDEKLTPKSFQTKLLKWLLRLQVNADDEIAGIVTGVLTILSEDGHSLSESLQLLEQHIFEIDVIHWHVIPTLTGAGWNGHLSWMGFEIGRLDGQKLAYRCQRAQALHHEQSARALDGAPALWSLPRKRKIIDVGRLFWRLRSQSIKKHGAIVLEALMQNMAVRHSESMWGELEDAFLFPFVLGAPIFEISSLRFAADAETWSCYSGVGKEGKQTWIHRGIWVDSVRMPSDWGQVQGFLGNVSRQHALDSVLDSELSGLVNQVARSIARSNNHLSASRRDESFLFLIIALEQVFSEKENTTKAVSGRTALVTHRALSKSYPETVKMVSDLYNRRSRLVHRGEVGISTDELLTASDLAVETLRCLIRLSALPESKSDEIHKRWLKKLDYLIAGFEAERPPSDAELIETGILEAANP